MKSTSVVALAVLLIASAGAEESIPSGRIFYAPFEDSFDAEARGEGRGVPVGTPTFAAGKKGRGLVVGDVDGAAGVQYPTENNFSLERGTMALWVQPTNWTGDDQLHHLFFRTKLGENGSFILYKYQNVSWGLTFLVDPDEGPRSRMYCYSPIKQWRPGEWHHIACSWTHYEGMAIYIDGEQVCSVASVRLTDKAPQLQMMFGGDWQRTGCRTVIDEAMIFKRMLAHHEIAMLAGKPSQPSPAEAPRDIPGVMLAHAILGQRVLARVYRDALGEPLVETARLTLSCRGKDDVLVTTKVDLTQTLSHLDLDLTAQPKGQYEAKLALTSGGQIRAVESLRVPKETDDTWDTVTDIGREDAVLPSFTPLKIAGERVSCYGREYELGGSGLLARVRSQDQEMLAGPIRVVAMGADGALDFSAGGLNVGKVSETEVRLSGALRAALLRIKTAALCRYDGTVWMILRFLPQAPLELKGLRVEIPVAAEQAKYLAYIAPRRIDAKRWGYDALPEGQGVVWRREFLPSAWLGTEDRGVGWYAESDEHWDIEGDDALTIERRGGAVVLCMNVIRTPRQVAKDFTIEFGVQATPVRPLAPDWRAYQWVPSVDITRFFLHLRTRPYPRRELAGQRPRGKVCYLYGYHSYFTSTLPKNPGEFREMVQRVKGFDLLSVPYTDVHFFPENAGDFWQKGHTMRTLPGARAVSYGPVCNAAVCHRSPYADWFVWYVSHLVREYGINGIYLDEMVPCGCANAEHGCGYVGPDGKRRVIYPLRAWNETFRRIRTLFAATGKPFWMAYHLSGSRVSPLATFGDCLLLGEDLYHRVAKNPDYTENTTAAQWRAGYATDAWGIPVVLLPQFKMNPDWMKSDDLAAKLMAAAVPHDLMVWTLFIKPETVMRIRSAMENFGIGQPDARFLPYWENETGVKTQDPRVKVSGYLRPGKVLLCVANWSTDAVEDLTIEVDASALNLPEELEARDAVTGDPVAVHQNRVMLSMPAKRLRLVAVGEGP